MLVLIAVPLLLTGVVYIRIVSVLKSMHNHVNTRRQSFIRRRMKTVVTALLIVGTFLLGWFPGVVWMMITCQSCFLPLDWLFQNNPRLVWICGITVNGLFLSKGILNPTVYALRMPNIQQAFQRMCLLGGGKRWKSDSVMRRPTITNGSTMVFRNLLAHQLLPNQYGVESECIIRVDDQVTNL
uniref:G-protein coupled receptors family 1 profile domain-containing protein n=1 Tax=Plectus sambesii TaxID=2011161 RepID=A0A914WC46_9BILA